MKILSGRELAGFIKQRQATAVKNLPIKPKLLIIRDSSNPVIAKYVNLKVNYGTDIGVTVEVFTAPDSAAIATKIKSANADSSTHAIILQLPILEKAKTESLTNLISPAKDVDGLSAHSHYDSATATAINWLLAGYNIPLKGKSIAIIGRGKLVGAPLYQMFQHSGYQVSLFHRGSDLTKLKKFDIIISATGVPGLVSDDLVSPGTTLIDAGTASENGVLIGDIAESVRNRQDLTAITPKVGGVGPLTVACLFDHVIQAAQVNNK